MLILPSQVTLGQEKNQGCDNERFNFSSQPSELLPELVLDFFAGCTYIPLCMNFMKTIQGPRTLVPLTLLTFCLLGAGIYHLLHNYRKTTTWGHTTGRIVSVHHYGSNHARRRIATVTYRTPHSPDTRTLRTRPAIHWRPGANVDVLYHPQRPDKALTNTFADLYDKGVIYCFVGSLFGALLLVILLANRHHKREAAKQ